MLIILIIILILSLIIMYFFFDYKILLLKRKIMLISNQNNKTSHSYNKFNERYLTDDFIFITPEATLGITTSTATVFIAPMNTAPIIKKLDIRMEVVILDKVKVNFEYWYYVNLPLGTNVNCRGWIRSDGFSTIQYNSTNTNNRVSRK